MSPLRACLLPFAIAVAAAIPAQAAPADHCLIRVGRLDAPLVELASSPWLRDGLLASFDLRPEALRETLLHLADTLPQSSTLAIDSPAALAALLELFALTDVLEQCRAAGDEALAPLRTRLQQRLRTPLQLHATVALQLGDADQAADWATGAQLLLFLPGGEVQVIGPDAEPGGSRAEVDLWQFGRMQDLGPRLRKLGLDFERGQKLSLRGSARGRQLQWDVAVDGPDAAAEPPAPPAPPQLVTAQWYLGAAQQAAEELFAALDRLPESAVEKLDSAALRGLGLLLQLPRSLQFAIDERGGVRWQGRSPAGPQPGALPETLLALAGGDFAGLAIGGDPLDEAILAADDALLGIEELAGRVGWRLPARVAQRLGPLLDWFEDDASALCEPGWAFVLGAPVAVPSVQLLDGDGTVLESAPSARLRLPALALVGRPRSPDDGWTFARRTTAALLQSLGRPDCELEFVDLGLGVRTAALPWQALFGGPRQRLQVEGDGQLHWLQRGDLLLLSSSLALSRAILAASEPPPGAAAWRLRVELPADGVVAQADAMFGLCDELERGPLQRLGRALGYDDEGAVDALRLRAAWSSMLRRVGGLAWCREVGDDGLRERFEWPLRRKS